MPAVSSRGSSRELLGISRTPTHEPSRTPPSTPGTACRPAPARPVRHQLSRWTEGSNPFGSSRSVRVRISPRARRHQMGLHGTNVRGVYHGPWRSAGAAKRSRRQAAARLERRDVSSPRLARIARTGRPWGGGGRSDLKSASCPTSDSDVYQRRDRADAEILGSSSGRVPGRKPSASPSWRARVPGCRHCGWLDVGEVVAPLVAILRRR